ncbi:hypothetical protein B0H19DRAFT_1155323 [Mycena capillaripes]|nr:hypothetical protein B0H19DRAFT_1155323 [Mycena capillaripes]
MSSPNPARDDEENGLDDRHHPDFYFQDGSAIFKLSNDGSGVLYNLHPAFLGQRSTFFNTMFSLPRGPDAPKEILTEGKTDDNPIELPRCISRFDFDNLLIYLYMGPSAYPDSEDFLVSIMKLSALFEIADGTTYTKAEFNRRGRLIHPALLFELGRCFRIDPWIEQAFRRLMDLPLVSLDFFQVSQIGPAGYFYLTQTQAKIQALRTKIAFHVPPLVNSVDCITPDACVSSWNREWQERVRQLIHHPEQPISCLDLLDQLRNVHIDGLCDGCQDLTVRWIWGKCLLTQEDRFIDEAVEELMKLQTDEPIRAALSASISGNSIITIT